MRYNKGIYQERSLPMYPLIRRYLRRVDVVYLLLCAACSAISIAVLVSIGQTQLGSNNKASVQLIASLLGLMLAAASEAIAEGDTVSIDFDTGVITDETTGRTFQAAPFPPFIQNIIAKGGLMNSLKD